MAIVLGSTNTLQTFWFLVVQWITLISCYPVRRGWKEDVERIFGRRGLRACQRATWTGVSVYVERFSRYWLIVVASCDLAIRIVSVPRRGLVTAAKTGGRLPVSVGRKKFYARASGARPAPLGRRPKLCPWKLATSWSRLVGTRQCDHDICLLHFRWMVRESRRRKWWVALGLFRPRCGGAMGLLRGVCRTPRLVSLTIVSKIYRLLVSAICVCVWKAGPCGAVSAMLSFVYVRVTVGDLGYEIWPHL